MFSNSLSWTVEYRDQLMSANGLVYKIAEVIHVLDHHRPSFLPKGIGEKEDAAMDSEFFALYYLCSSTISDHLRKHLACPQGDF